MKTRKNTGLRAVVMGCAAALATASALGESAAASGGAAPAASTTATAATPAAAANEVPEDLNPTGTTSEGTINAGSKYDYDSKLAAFWQTQIANAKNAVAAAAKETDDKKKPAFCYAKLSEEDARNKLDRAITDFLQKKDVPKQLQTSIDALSKNAESTSAGTKKEQDALARIQEAEKLLPDAKRKADLAEANMKSAKDVRDALNTKLIAHATDGKPVDLKLLDAFKEADKVSGSASSAWTAARDERDKIQAELDAATKTVKEERAAAANKELETLQAKKKTAESEREKAHSALRLAITEMQSRPEQSPIDFETRLKDTAWLDACSKLKEAALSGGVLTEKDAAEEAKNTRKMADDARATDVLRKAPSTPSALGTGSGYIETGGAPDRMTYSLFSALGADQKTTGTQMLLTLNLGQLWNDKDSFLKQPALVRNLFVRASVPLAATKDVSLADPSTGATTPATTDPDSVSRMSFVLGTSLLDSTDPRLDDHKECYKIANLYDAMELHVEGAEKSGSQERAADYVDVCNRVAANRQRLALRGGIGLLTKAEDTQVEYLAGALVWAPTSWLYFNGLYQRLFLPTKLHQFGGGISTSFNVTDDVSDSGVSAWARIGLDVLVLGVNDEEKGTTDVEVRTQFTTRFRLVNTGILTFGIGPKVVGSQIQNPGLLASVGLTYDADTLIDSFMGPPATPAPAK